MRDVGSDYPLRVVLSLLGVPVEDEPRILKLTQEVFGVHDPDLARDQEEAEDVGFAESAINDFFAYFAALSQDRRANPRDDLASIIANARIDGEPIPSHEEMSYYLVLAAAGHDTTSSTIAGAMRALAEDPSLLKRVQGDPSLIPALIEEAVRWTTPVKVFMRTAIRDTEIRGRLIREGDWLMLCYASGNRDEEVFQDPFAFRIDRPQNQHVAFGYGAHLCLGQHLARLEMRILLEQLLPRLASLELAGEPRMSHSLFVNGLKSLPISYMMA